VLGGVLDIPLRQERGDGLFLLAPVSIESPVQ
jgi:hypothetical protein